MNNIIYLISLFTFFKHSDTLITRAHQHALTTLRSPFVPCSQHPAHPIEHAPKWGCWCHSRYVISLCPNGENFRKCICAHACKYVCTTCVRGPGDTCLCKIVRACGVRITLVFASSHFSACILIFSSQMDTAAASAPAGGVVGAAISLSLYDSTLCVLATASECDAPRLDAPAELLRDFQHVLWLGPSSAAVTSAAERLPEVWTRVTGTTSGCVLYRAAPPHRSPLQVRLPGSTSSVSGF